MKNTIVLYSMLLKMPLNQIHTSNVLTNVMVLNSFLKSLFYFYFLALKCTPFLKSILYPVLGLLDLPNNHKIILVLENDDVKDYSQ